MSLERSLAQAKAVCLAEIEQQRVLRAEVEREHAEFLREADEQARTRASAARAGEHGPDAQRLQQRLDAGETTPEAIRDGQDPDPSAQVGRQRWHETVRTWASDPDVQALRDQRMAPGEYDAAPGWRETSSATWRHTDWV